MRVNMPGLEVRDDSLNEAADTVVGRVVSSIGICEFTTGGFPGRGEHSQSDAALFPNVTLKALFTGVISR